MKKKAQLKILLILLVTFTAANGFSQVDNYANKVWDTTKGHGIDKPSVLKNLKTTNDITIDQSQIKL